MISFVLGASIPQKISNKFHKAEKRFPIDGERFLIFFVKCIDKHIYVCYNDKNA